MADDPEPCVSVTIDPNNNKLNIEDLEQICTIGTAYRDLKLENLMLSKDGHVKLTDFGFAKEVMDRTWTMCGTPEYLAPEIVTHEGHCEAVDWWSLGILVYEMNVGIPPFRGKVLSDVFSKILDGKVKFPKNFDPNARDLVKRLLQRDPYKRLGNLKNGAQDVMNHKWFADISWNDVVEIKLIPPVIPTVYSSGDTGNFDSYDEESDTDTAASPVEQNLFDKW